MMIKKLFFILLALILLYLSFLFFYPDIPKLKKEAPKETAFMRHRIKEARTQGKTLRIRQKWVPLTRISPSLVKAVLIAEDDKFWAHEGFDFEAIQKALEKDIKARKFKFGGSTVSQQLAKNLYLSPSKNPVRKIKEAVLTFRIERSLSKRRIIELYLNLVEWGEGIFGIEAAAQAYFGKSAGDLTAEESANLAAVLPNPRRYHSVGQSRFVQYRSRLIYDIMVRRGLVPPLYEEIQAPEGEVGILEPEKTPEPAGEPKNSP